jgi:hypothetical protein
MLLVLPGRLISLAPALPTVVPQRPGRRVLLLVPPVLKARLRVQLDQVGLVARAEPVARVGFHAQVVRLAPVVRVAVLVAHPARVAQVVRPVVLAAPPVRA